MTKIVLTGSYNGQDSLGDECLLRAVVYRFRQIKPACDIEYHLHGTDTAFCRQFSAESGARAAQGLQSAIWQLASVIRRTRLPLSIARRIAHAVAPAVAAAGWRPLAVPMDAIRQADLLFNYGGTLFSQPWYQLNAPSNFWCARIVKQHGGRVVFGPQQYGPLDAGYSRELCDFLAQCTDDWCTRNTADLDMLQVAPEDRAHRLVHDEVFSALGLYPSLQRLPAEYILVNLRAMSFDDENELESERYARFAALLDRLMQSRGLPVVFFGVSDGSFCNDDAAFHAIRQRVSRPEQLSSVGRVEDEHALFALARKAAFVVSMSFHGCILSGIAGAPFVPVTEGRYYDHKYVDFDRYTGGQQVPLLALSEIDVERDFELVDAYARRFEIDRVHSTRIAANRQLDEFYRGILAGT